jgi:DNA invertase Pin-like site-specific DNA recombinase
VPVAPKQKSFVAYSRVSTGEQGRSGLGLEAQKAAIHDLVRSRGGLLVLPVFVEIESGRKVERVKLQKAIAKARLLGATLVVAKLDRLARNASFLMSLVDSGVDVVFCDLPDLPEGAVGRFMLQQMAAVAELEAGLISQRTKAALAAAKARGVALGGFRGVKVDPGLGTLARQEKARETARRIAEVIEEIIREEGISSASGIARRLTEMGVKTPRGCDQWQAAQVQKVLMLAR